ncbi:activator-dependent family glycosyltransferase [Sphaerisporangium dianthi]|uniref:Activator-dependent family glycosyltransferase n=1 Tax=Sphaerisporangium dianthi TaxID=1436120 RepID=A0ABV9CMK9_9ACTN
MRVLFVTYGEKTQFYGMVQLACALFSAGHEVRVASEPALSEVITDAGLTAVPVGRDSELYRIVYTFAGRENVRWSTTAPPFHLVDAPAEKITYADLQAGYHETVRWWWRLVNDPMVPDLVEFCRAWRPDLVLWEPVTYAAPIAATLTGAAHARMLWGLDVFGHMRGHYLRLRDQEPAVPGGDTLAGWLDMVAGKYGGAFSEEMTSGHFTIDQLPPTMRLDTGLPAVSMRYVPYGGRSVVPRWLWDPPERPRIGFTLGTSAVERMGGYVVSVDELLGALDGLDVEIVATVPAEEQDKLGTLPPNVRLEEFVPLQALASTCTAMISHGGWGTILTTGLAGVPQLTLTHQFDAPILGRKLAEQGGALSIEAKDVTGDTMRALLTRLLTEPSFTAGAASFREQMLAMPTPADLVPELERRVAEHRS